MPPPSRRTKYKTYNRFKSQKDRLLKVKIRDKSNWPLLPNSYSKIEPVWRVKFEQQGNSPSNDESDQWGKEAESTHEEIVENSHNNGGARGKRARGWEIIMIENP